MNSKRNYKEILKRLNAFSNNMRLSYYATIRELAELYKHVEFNPDKPFSFSDYPISDEANAIFRQMYSLLYAKTKAGIKSEWRNSNIENDKLVNQFLKDRAKNKAFEKYFNQNNEALAAYTARVGRDGLNLSQRVWRNVSQFKEEIEMSFDVGFREGKSAAALSRDIRKHLEEPDKLFRRVRDEHGELHLSKRAKAYHPGQGVYRSSYKNSLRLARTEINMAYREADILRWQQLDFIVGYEVKRSKTNPYDCVICESLKGRYPKDFKFVGWHPQCYCYVVPIMMTDEEYAELQAQILEGEEPHVKSENEVNELPEGFTDYIKDNKERIQNAKSSPYFIRDNVANFKPILQDVAPYVFTLDSAKSLGFNANGRIDSDYEKTIRGFNLERFNKDINSLASKYGIDITERRITSSSGEVMFDILGNDNFRLQRSFLNNIAYHDLLTIPDSVQGKGFSKELFQSLYRQYQNAGIKEIRVQANITVGGYTWAKYGFFAKSKSYDDIISWARFQLSEKQITKANYNKFEKWINLYKGKDIPMYELAQFKYGKKLLLGSNWSGFLDLNNPLQRKMFEDYLRSK